MAEKYSKEQLQALAEAAARRHGVDPTMFKAQIETESKWKTDAVSPAGAKGIAQFMPKTAKGFGIDPLDPVQALDASAKYMAQLTKKFGSEDLARQAYNWGEGNLKRYLANPNKVAMPKETADYNMKIASAAGVKPAAAGAAPVAAPPARAAGAPAMADAQQAQDPMSLAFDEINQGLPPGTLLQQPTEQQAQAPDSMDWGRRLEQLNAQKDKPLALAEGGDYGEGLDAFSERVTSDAARAQESTLSKMFADIGGAQEEPAVKLPSSIDRYLEKILA